MLQPCERQIGQDEPVRSQFLQETDFLDLLLEALGALARRDGTEPFEAADLIVLKGRQQPRHPGFTLGRHRCSDGLEQGLLVVPPRGDHLPPDIPLAEQEIMMLDEPETGTRHQLGLVEHGCRFPAKIGHQPALGMWADHRTSEQSERRLVMLEQGPSAPAIKRSDRGDPRRYAIEVPAEMIEDRRGNELDRVERTAGHLEEADLEGERQPVQGAAAFSNRSQLALVECEEMLNLECRQHLRKPVTAEVSMLPSAHRALLHRAGGRVGNFCAPKIRVTLPARRPSSPLPFSAMHKRSSAQRKIGTSGNKGLLRAKSCCQIRAEGNRILRHPPCCSATLACQRPTIRTPPPRSVPSRRPAARGSTKRGPPADVGIGPSSIACSIVCAKATRSSSGNSTVCRAR